MSAPHVAASGSDKCALLLHQLDGAQRHLAAAEELCELELWQVHTITRSTASTANNPRFS